MPADGPQRVGDCFVPDDVVHRNDARRCKFDASGEAAAPMAAVAAACKRRPLWPFLMSNRRHVVPPLVIAEDDLRDGLSIVHAALDAADACCIR